MVKLLVGRKGSGKTKSMVTLANDRVESSNGSVVFINKNHRLMYSLKYKIRVVCMEEYEDNPDHVHLPLKSCILLILSHRLSLLCLLFRFSKISLWQWV
jgi:hypothetical protein